MTEKPAPMMWVNYGTKETLWKRFELRDAWFALADDHIIAAQIIADLTRRPDDPEG